jgi:hypothetical protein
MHRTTQLTNKEECGPCHVFARYTLVFALQLRKKHGKTSVRVAFPATINAPKTYPKCGCAMKRKSLKLLWEKNFGPTPF